MSGLMAHPRSSAMGGGQRRSKRATLLAFSGLLVFFYFVSTLSPSARGRDHGSYGFPNLHTNLKSSSSILESVRLEQYMNRKTDPSSQLRSTASFDWASVRYRHRPIEPLRQLPSARPVSLPQIQHHFPPESPRGGRVREARRAQVLELFKKNWASYRKYAWKKDALQPLTAGYKDQFSGWAATLVDTLDTLWIMGLRDEFNEAVAAVADIDFGNSTSPSVNMFEVNIRYLGGLLSAYDLSGREILLTKAVELGNLLYAGYNTPNRMPVDFIPFLQAQKGDGLTVEPSVVSASPGTLSMEMTRLSQVTGDPKYYDAVSRVMDVFEQGQNYTKIPGLWPVYVSMDRQDVTSGSSFSIAGSADSLYEYLPKMYALLGGLELRYDDMSRQFLEAANRTLFFRPMLPREDDVLMIGTARAETRDDMLEPIVHLDPESEHLGCFVGGVYALAGKLFRRPEWIDDIGAKLTKGCVYAYRAMPTGIMPERYNMAPCASRSKCPWDEAAFDREKKKRPEWRPHLPKGFTTAKDPRYLLRPEAIESVFVMYRVTGRQEYQDAAWDMFQAVRNATATPFANAAVMDVTRSEYPPQQEDYMESFWLAETLKYFYLAFSPPDLISLDDYVLNTEAHPFRRPKSNMPLRPSPRVEFRRR